MTKKIVVDPFFDGEGVAVEGGVTYTPVEDTDHGRALPTGPSGLKGTVIPRAASGSGGAPSGWQGAGQVRTEIHVDPDIPGQSIVVKVADLQSDKVSTALQETSAVDPRIRASAVYNALAAGSPPEKQIAPPQDVQEVAPVTGVSPLKAFNSTAPTNSPNEAPVMPDKTQPTAPTEWVTFEIEGFGEHRAPYHRVIRSGSNLVLVYDTNCDGTQRFFPRTTDKPLGIHVAGEPVAYFAHTTGIEFSDDGVDYCVLLVEHEAPIMTGPDGMEL
jgi:hypothetical protein